MEQLQINGGGLEAGSLPARSGIANTDVVIVFLPCAGSAFA
jgi:hypothetical protein